LRVFDVMGREVRTLAVGTRGVVGWDLCDQSGRRVPAGVYQVMLDPAGNAGDRCRRILVLDD
jgi:hypothetical protein